MECNLILPNVNSIPHTILDFLYTFSNYIFAPRENRTPNSYLQGTCYRHLTIGAYIIVTAFRGFEPLLSA